MCAKCDCQDLKVKDDDEFKGNILRLDCVFYWNKATELQTLQSTDAKRAADVNLLTYFFFAHFLHVHFQAF